jgi:hypothetical protein
MNDKDMKFSNNPHYHSFVFKTLPGSAKIFLIYCGKKMEFLENYKTALAYSPYKYL